MANEYTKTSNEITETLLEAMDTVIAARISQLPYDKTIICTIIDDSQAGIGKYKVTADNAVNIFNAYADPDIQYYKDTQVYVKILNNNTGISRIITGKYIPRVEAQNINKGSNGIFYISSDVEKITLDKSIICRNEEIGQENILLPSPIYGYSGVKFTFKYKKRNLNTNKNAKLLAQIEFKGENSFPVEYDDNIIFVVDENNYLPVNNLINSSNPDLEVSSTLYIDFNHQNLNIEEIDIKAIFENQNIINFDENDYAFIITNIDIEFGYWIKNLGHYNDALLILPNIENGNISSQFYDDGVNSGQAFTYRYLQVDNENVIKEVELFNTDNPIIQTDKVFWGIYDSSVNYKELPEYAWAIGSGTTARYWQSLNVLDAEGKKAKNNIPLNTNIEKTKVGLYFSYYYEGDGLLRAEDFYLYNSSFSSKTGSVTKGLEATFDDGFNGNYFIYDKDGNLLNNHEATIERTITLSYVNIANPQDIIKDNEKFEYSLDSDKESMFQIISEKKEDLVYKIAYKINNNYNQNYTNNTIHFTLIHNGTKYQLDKELLFGYSGSEENKINIRVSLLKNNIKVDGLNINNLGEYQLVVDVYNYLNQKQTGYIFSNFQNLVDSKRESDINISFINERVIKIDYIISNKILATTYYPLAFYTNEEYFYNGPSTITYDEKGNIKFNKIKCSLLDNEKNLLEDVKWDEEQNTYFKLGSDGEFAPAKICDLSSGHDFLIKARKNGNIIWEQVLWFEKNQNITTTKNESTANNVTIGNDEIVNVSLGRISENNDDDKTLNTLLIGEISSSQEEENNTFGLFGYRKNKPIFSLTDTGYLRIGNENGNDSNNLLGDSSVSSESAILKGVWTVTNATKLVSTNSLNGLSIGNDQQLIYFNNGIPQVSNSNIGANNKPVYLNNGAITAINGTIGADEQFVYLNNGNITATTATKGNSQQPIYIEGGILKPVGQVKITLSDNSEQNLDIVTAIQYIIDALQNNVQLKSGINNIWKDILPNN